MQKVARIGSIALIFVLILKRYLDQQLYLQTLNLLLTKEYLYTKITKNIIQDFVIS